MALNIIVGIDWLFPPLIIVGSYPYNLQWFYSPAARNPDHSDGWAFGSQPPSTPQRTKKRRTLLTYGTVGYAGECSGHMQPSNTMSSPNRLVRVVAGGS
jgi:hypothetical protein